MNINNIDKSTQNFITIWQQLMVNALLMIRYWYRIWHWYMQVPIQILAKIIFFHVNFKNYFTNFRDYECSWNGVKPNWFIHCNVKGKLLGAGGRTLLGRCIPNRNYSERGIYCVIKTQATFVLESRYYVPTISPGPANYMLVVLLLDGDLGVSHARQEVPRHLFQMLLNCFHIAGRPLQLNLLLTFTELNMHLKKKKNSKYTPT